jgi:hypothetical protein
MQNAPAVSYPVGRLHIRVALAAVLLLGASAIALWYFQADHPGWRQALALCVWLLCAGLALLAENLPGNGGVLRWDGQNWTWESRGTVRVGTVVPRADWQMGILLEFRAPASPVRWLCVERGETGSWNALRRALWAPGPADSARPAAPAG